MSRPTPEEQSPRKRRKVNAEASSNDGQYSFRLAAETSASLPSQPLRPAVNALPYVDGIVPNAYTHPSYPSAAWMATHIDNNVQATNPIQPHFNYFMTALNTPEEISGTSGSFEDNFEFTSSAAYVPASQPTEQPFFFNSFGGLPTNSRSNVQPTRPFWSESTMGGRSDSVPTSGDFSVPQTSQQAILSQKNRLKSSIAENPDLPRNGLAIPVLNSVHGGEINQDAHQILTEIAKIRKETLDRHSALIGTTISERVGSTNESVVFKVQQYPESVAHSATSVLPDAADVLSRLFRRVDLEGSDARQELRSLISLWAGNNSQSIANVANGLLEELEKGSKFLGLDPPVPNSSSQSTAPPILIRSRQGQGYRCGRSPCSNCSQDWKPKQKLHSHIAAKYYGTIKPWVCPICDWKSINKDGYNLHLKSKHHLLGDGRKTRQVKRKAEVMSGDASTPETYWESSTPGSYMSSGAEEGTSPGDIIQDIGEEGDTSSGPGPTTFANWQRTWENQPTLGVTAPFFSSTSRDIQQRSASYIDQATPQDNSESLNFFESTPQPITKEDYQFDDIPIQSGDGVDWFDWVNYDYTEREMGTVDIPLEK